MKPDGVATTDPADDVVEPVPEAAENVEQVQQDSSPSSFQHEKPENEGEQEGANATLPPSGKEVNGKVSKPKGTTKAPVKTKLGTAGTKASNTTGAAARPATTQSRAANGVMKAASNGASKKPASMISETKKKNAPVGAAAQVKKVPTAASVALRTQVKAAERKAVGSAGAVPSTSSGVRKAAATSSTLSKKPVAGGSSTPFKPKSTAPRPTTAPAAKASVSAASKAAPIPKTTRPIVATASRPTTSSAPVRLTTTASKSTALRTSVSASESASTRPSKVSNTVAAKKDIKTITSAAARNPLASTTTRSTASKASKPESLKPGTSSKRFPADPKKSIPKTAETRHVPTWKVPPSPRNISSRPASGRMAAELSNNKQGLTSNLVSVKHQTAKPMQSVLPLVVKEKPSEEHSSVPVESSVILEAAASVRTAAIELVESVMEAQTPSELAQPDQQTRELVEGQGEGLQVPVSENSKVDAVSTVTVDAEPLAIQSVANVPVLVISNPPTVVPDSEKVHGNILVVVPMAHEMNEHEPVTVPLCEVPNIVQVSSRDLEVVEKQEQIIHNFEEEEEEREGSQQVSVSDMSGTQPTEESRPGSAGLAGSVWRAGGLLSEFDSEDVSCSQQGASELSAPGVLEGTESMDDLGEASLKGADGEGASAGSPDFEKFPDIPVNDDEDDEDRVDDMEVGSEMTEDPHRQCNDNEEEDEDVEMASEGVTESGLESYGNADEDDLTEDYRLDNLNRMQPSSIVPTGLSAANPFADAWMHSPQPDPTLVSSPSSNPWQTYTELPNVPAAQACLDIGSAKTDLSFPPAVMDPVPSSPQPSSEPAAEMDMGLKQGLASHSQHISQSSTLLGPELAIHTCSDASTPEELKDYSISPILEKQKDTSVSPSPVALPDIMQDLGIGRPDHTGSEREEEPETLPADDMLAGLSTMLTSALSSHSSAIGDEASDTEGDMQISDPTEPGSTGNECFDGRQVVDSMSALVVECEEACAELDGGGGSDTPQSATSAASYGFEGTTSNSNAQSTTESCIKSPGIFSLENEQFPDEAKDPSLIKELNLAPAGAPAGADLVDQQRELQLNSEQEYMLRGKVSEEPCSIRGTVPNETGLGGSFSSEHQKNFDIDSPLPYYSTTCEKTDGFLTGSDVCAEQQEKVLTVHMTKPSKHNSGLRVDHVTRLLIDLPPRMPNVECSTQLRRLEHHQQQLEEIEQWREQKNRMAERQMQEVEEEKKEEGEFEQNNREEKERALEEQKRDLLHLQIQQQQQELKQRQQIMQWQQELEHHAQQKHQNSLQKNLTTVLLSPSGLCTIYEALETSDAEGDCGDHMEEKEMVLKIKVEHECPPKERSSIPKTGFRSDNADSSPSTSSPNLIKDHEGLIHSVTLDSPPLSGSSSPKQPSPLELDWSMKADIVQQLINQTLLLNGDNCSPLLLLPGGAAGTLSPLETSLWPNLPPLTPPSATVTSVSSFSAEISGSSPQGEWTVVELETHH